MAAEVYPLRLGCTAPAARLPAVGVSLPYAPTHGDAPEGQEDYDDRTVGLYTTRAPREQRAPLPYALGCIGVVTDGVTGRVSLSPARGMHRRAAQLPRARTSRSTMPSGR